MDMDDSESGGFVIPFFWGTKLKGNAKSEWHQDSESPHILNVKQIALDPKASKKRTVVGCSSMIGDKSVDFVLCTLIPGRTDQCNLNLCFSDDIVFRILEGDGPVHLTGFVQQVMDLGSPDDELDYDSEAMADADDFAAAADMMVRNKRKRNDDQTNKRARRKADSDSDDSDDDDTVAGLTKEETKDMQGIFGKLDKKAVQKNIGSFRNSAEELQDLVQNYEKCGGNWDYVLKYQVGSSEEDLPRYKKMIEKVQATGQCKKFNKKQRAAIKANLEEEGNAESLGEEDSSEAESMDDESDDSIVVPDDESSEEEDSEEDSEDDSDFSEEPSPVKPKAKTPKAKTPKAKAKTPSKGSASAKATPAKGKTPSKHKPAPKNLKEARKALSAMSSTPKKQSKFKNFCAQTLKIQDAKLIDELWKDQQKSK